jgi:hypothetical protein
MEDSPACHFTAPDSLGDNPFPANDGRHAEWETFSTDAVVGLSRLISSLQEVSGVSDAASYEVWRLRYAELAPPAVYEPTWVFRMVSEDQTHWITGRFTRLLGKAFELFIRDPEDLECAKQIVQRLAAAMAVALGKNVGDSAQVAQWRKWWSPTKATLRRRSSNLNRARKIISTAQTVASSDRVPDIVEDPGGRPYWRADSVAARECPTFLRPAKVERLAAIAKLRKDAAEVVQRTRPQGRQELEQCLWPVFSEYAEHVFDKMADAKLSASSLGGRSRAYGIWLRSKCLPAVVDDICRPIIGQFPVTVRYVAEIVGEVSRPQELVILRQVLWVTIAEEVIPGPDSSTKRLENRLINTLLEERIPLWAAKSTQRRLATAPEVATQPQSASGSRDPGAAPDKAASGRATPEPEQPSSPRAPAPETPGDPSRLTACPPQRIAEGAMESDTESARLEAACSRLEAKFSPEQRAELQASLLKIAETLEQSDKYQENLLRRIGVRTDLEDREEFWLRLWAAGRYAGFSNEEFWNLTPRELCAVLELKASELEVRASATASILRPEPGSAAAPKLAEESGEQEAAAATTQRPELPPPPADTQARVPLPDLLREAEGRTADPKLRNKLVAVLRYSRYFEDLKVLKTACKGYQTPALLDQQFSHLDVWAAMKADDKADIAKGHFQPGVFAWSLVKRIIGLSGQHNRTLKNYRNALRKAGLL